MRLRKRSLEASASISVQMRLRLRVVASMTTTAAFESYVRARSLIGTPCVFARSRPGTYVVISEPGEKPSLRFHCRGWIGLFATFRGIDVSAKSTLTPVSVFVDGFVKRLFG